MDSYSPIVIKQGHPSFVIARIGRPSFRAKSNEAENRKLNEVKSLNSATARKNDEALI